MGTIRAAPDGAGVLGLATECPKKGPMINDRYFDLSFWLGCRGV
jgi:hypothetical protein